MAASQFDFVNVVVADRDLVVTSSAAHVCRLEPRQSVLAWHCDLDDGTPTGENDPASFVRWVCPGLQPGPSATGADVPLLDVRRTGPQSDLGRLVERFGRLAGLSSRRGAGEAEARFAYTDPAAILDGALRERLEHWPPALHGDGVERPAELSSLRFTSEGLVLESVSWWGSAPALDHQLGLALDIADRLTAPR